jgi:putative tryptophan/tyrosine transport system substrate-binding protein
LNTRRKLLIALGASALTAPFGSFAQQAGKVWHVGFLIPRSRPTSVDADYFRAFPKGMRELGYVEGKNLVIEWRTADGKYERLPGLAAELVQLKVDVIVAGTQIATSVAQKATTTIPIVMVNVTDPVGSGLVTSLARPGGNITGLSNISGEISTKHLEILLSMMPKLSRVALLVNPATSENVAALKNIQAAAPRVGVTVLPLEARNLQEIENAFFRMTKENAGAVIVPREPVFNQNARQIAELAIKHRMPSAFGSGEPVEVGGLVSYGSSSADAYQRAATYVDKILKGAKPADLPIEQPTKFELVINMKTAKALGITIPQSVLIGVDRVIE